MRYKFLCLLLLLGMFVVSAPILRATELRGDVVGLAGPMVGVGVALFEGEAEQEVQDRSPDRDSSQWEVSL